MCSNDFNDRNVVYVRVRMQNRYILVSFKFSLARPQTKYLKGHYQNLNLLNCVDTKPRNERRTVSYLFSRRKECGLAMGVGSRVMVVDF